MEPTSDGEVQADEILYLSVSRCLGPMPGRRAPQDVSHEQRVRPVPDWLRGQGGLRWTKSLNTCD